MNRFVRIIRDIWRGAHDMPYVGPHPGNIWMVAFIAMGAYAGFHGGIRGMLVGAGIMIIFMGPMYAIGCVDRARISDAQTKLHSFTNEVR